MSVNRGSVPLIKQIRAERNGKPIVPSMKAEIRMALLAGERLSNRDVPGRFGVSITALNDAIKDLERVGYKSDREESSETGAVHWITNPKHYPREDSGPTRKRPARSKRAGGRTPEPTPELDGQAFEPIALGQTFVVCQAQLEDDGTVTWTLRRDDGLELTVSGEEPT